ncbi:MAG TPA: nitroreductase family deazaflavin-dependent oxidoreductase [Acidimicrobiales bacterium]
MSAISNPPYQQPDYSLLGAEHVQRYQETDGEVGSIWNGVPVLLLTTTGRRSGEPRTTPLIHGRDGDDYLVVASMGGAPQHPNWYRNLEATPAAQIQVKAEHIAVTARTANETEKPRLWKIVSELWPNYDAYQARTERVIPVVVLTPSADS